MLYVCSNPTHSLCFQICKNLSWMSRHLIYTLIWHPQSHSLWTGNCHGEVDDKRTMNECKFDWGFDNSFIYYPQCLYMYMFVYDISSKCLIVSMWYLVGLVQSNWLKTCSISRCFCSCLQTQWSPSCWIRGGLGIVWCHFVSFAWASKPQIVDIDTNKEHVKKVARKNQLSL